MRLLLLAFSLAARSAFACTGLPKPVVDCGEYKDKRRERDCVGVEFGCVEAGWFSKTNTKYPNQNVDAIQICKDQGYVEGADEEMYGGNSGHECKLPNKPGEKNTMMKSGVLTNLGYTVTWKCKGVKNCDAEREEKVVPSCGDLPTPVVHCGEYSGWACTNKGLGCVGAGWFSKTNNKTPNFQVNADRICKQQGYTGIDRKWYGGNYGYQCRYPGLSWDSANKGGGTITWLGWSVTWKCAGEQKCTPTAPPTSPPTPPPTTPAPQIKCKDQKTIWDCTKGFCKAKGKGDKFKCKAKKCKKEFKKDMKKDPPVEDNCNASPYCEIVKKTKRGNTKVECKEIK